ncbi:Pr6Pr family membrane protein [Thermomonas sp. S9]|uniref:Pr6Pr family membrane protein n=1 Tax=Thermomonas sp. S9 TaxID=2885203 RepID=UPI00216AF336|nr:Pr6Pr family membrane protein [Thermomonas sp. S9]MCR6497289.1 Pr6Pr family membrane protein [Thermomonas sp. S9]
MAKARLFAATLGLLAVSALALQLVLTLQATHSQSRNIWSGVWLFVGYFTILSNMLVAWVALRGALRADGGRDLQWRGCAVTAIVLVGIGYHLLLRNIWDPQGAALLADLLLHYAVPAGALLWWLAYPPLRHIPSRSPLHWLAWPVGYAIYALTRGALTGFYPYPFVNVIQFGMARVLVNVVALCAVFVATGYLLRALAHARQRQV